MRHQRTRKDIPSTMIGVISLAAIAVWQFCVFVTFKTQPGLVNIHEGRLPSWLAAGFGLITCGAALLFFSTFPRDGVSSEMQITSQAS